MQATSFEALLDVIDHEIAPTLVQDMGEIKEKANRSIRRRKPYISFFLGPTELALEVGSILEIGGIPQVTRLPNLPPWIRGITQIRGEVLSVVDFVRLFSLPQGPILHRKKSYVLFSHQELRFCLIVDRIGGVLHIDKQRDPLEPYTGESGDPLAGLAKFFMGVYSGEQRRVFVLDSEQLGTAPLIRKWR